LFKDLFECGDRYCCELPEEDEIKLKNFLNLIQPFELICLLTEYMVCGNINALPKYSEDLT